MQKWQVCVHLSTHVDSIFTLQEKLSENWHLKLTALGLEDWTGGSSG